jgi:hypothetical protein
MIRSKRHSSQTWQEGHGCSTPPRFMAGRSYPSRTRLLLISWGNFCGAEEGSLANHRGRRGRRSGFQEDVTGRPMRPGASAGQRDREDLPKIGPSHSSGHSSINGLHVAYNTPGQPALYIRTSVFGRQRPQYSRPKTGFSIENPPRVVVPAAAPEKRLNR